MTGRCGCVDWSRTMCGVARHRMLPPAGSTGIPPHASKRGKVVHRGWQHGCREIGNARATLRQTPPAARRSPARQRPRRGHNRCTCSSASRIPHSPRQTHRQAGFARPAPHVFPQAGSGSASCIGLCRTRGRPIMQTLSERNGLTVGRGSIAAYRGATACAYANGVTQLSMSRAAAHHSRFARTARLSIPVVNRSAGLGEV